MDHDSAKVGNPPSSVIEHVAAPSLPCPSPLTTSTPQQLLVVTGIATLKVQIRNLEQNNLQNETTRSISTVQEDENRWEETIMPSQKRTKGGYYVERRGGFMRAMSLAVFNSKLW